MVLAHDREVVPGAVGVQVRLVRAAAGVVGAYPVLAAGRSCQREAPDELAGAAQLAAWRGRVGVPRAVVVLLDLHRHALAVLVRADGDRCLERAGVVVDPVQGASEVLAGVVAADEHRHAGGDVDVVCDGLRRVPGVAAEGGAERRAARRRVVGRQVALGVDPARLDRLLGRTPERLRVDRHGPPGRRGAQVGRDRDPRLVRVVRLVGGQRQRRRYPRDRHCAGPGRGLRGRVAGVAGRIGVGAEHRGLVGEREGALRPGLDRDLLDGCACPDPSDRNRRVQRRIARAELQGTGDRHALADDGR